MKPDNTTQNRAALAEELKRVENELADMRNEIAAFESRCNKKTLRLMGVTDPRWSELLYTVGGVESRAHSLRDRLAQIDKSIAYQRRVEESISNARACRAAMTEAEQQAAELETQFARLRQRIDVIEAECCAAEEKAVNDEAEAAQAYAKALASGDVSAEKATLERLKKAQAVVIAGKVKGNMIGALVSEAEKLEAQAEAAKTEADEQRRRMYEEITIHLRDRWDRAAKGLADVGAKLTTAAHRAGESDGLWQLHVPLFGSENGDFIYDGSLCEIPGEIENVLKEVLQ
jgi:predicted  nucleic acid-binding Zn-ribbon protein